MRIPNMTQPEDGKHLVKSYLESRLNEWARWAKSGNNFGLGYPPYSVEYRLMTEGHVVRQSFGLKLMPCHPGAEEMDELLREMSAQCYEMAYVIRFYYLNPQGISESARQLGISRTVLESELYKARCWLAGRLTTSGKVKELTSHFRRLQKSNWGKI